MISASDLSRLIAAATKGPLTVKPRTMQIGTRTSPTGFDLVDKHGVVYAWSWNADDAALIVALVNLAPEIVALVEIAEAAREAIAAQERLDIASDTCDCCGTGPIPAGRYDGHYRVCTVLAASNARDKAFSAYAALAKRERGQG